MEKITIELDEEEIEIVEELLNSGGFDSPTIASSRLRSALEVWMSVRSSTTVGPVALIACRQALANAILCGILQQITEATTEEK
jgi:Arc/MetJ-type ribon-helix-helix transcriptional regulator